MFTWMDEEWTRDVGLMLVGWVAGVALATGALYVLGALLF